MGKKTFSIAPEQAKYFSDLDNSILKWSVDLGKAELQADSVRETLKSLYQSRQKQVIAALTGLGLNPSAVAAVQVGVDGTLSVEMADTPEASASPES